MFAVNGQSTGPPTGQAKSEDSDATRSLSNKEVQHAPDEDQHKSSPTTADPTVVPASKAPESAGGVNPASQAPESAGGVNPASKAPDSARDTQPAYTTPGAVGGHQEIVLQKVAPVNP